MYAIIGAGPMGLASARNLQKLGSRNVLDCGLQACSGTRKT